MRATSYGDANLDGVFDSSDLVTVFAAGQYEDGLPSNSGWASGDWNGDQEFDSSDLVWVFQEGGYRNAAGAGPQAVPEPNCACALCSILLLPLVRRKTRTKV